MSGSSRRGIGAVDLLLDGFAGYLRSERGVTETWRRRSEPSPESPPPGTAPGRYQPPDPLRAFLDSL